MKRRNDMKRLICVLCVFGLFGCATGIEPRTDVKTFPGQQYPKPVVLSAVQLGDEAPTLVVGTKYHFRQGNAITKQWINISWLVKDRIVWQGKEGYIIDTSGGMGANFMIWDTSLNAMATTDAQGKPTAAYDPCMRLFVFPLKVGATYNVTYDFYNAGKKHSGIADTIKVEGKETVRVPAGTYNAFVVKRMATKITEYHYYAPMVGFPVKWQWSQAIDHPNGPGEYVTELVKIEKEATK